MLPGSLLGCGGRGSLGKREKAGNPCTMLFLSLPHEGWVLGTGCPGVSLLTTRRVRQEAGQEPWSDLRSRKVGLQSLGGSISVRAGPRHPGSRAELGIQSLGVPEGSAGSGGGNWEARPPRSSVQPELSWTGSVPSPDGLLHPEAALLLSARVLHPGEVRSPHLVS